MVVVLALLAGCGGGNGDRLSKAQYEQRIQAQGRAVEQAVSGITAGPTSLEALARQVADAEGAVGRAAANLAAAKPPEEARKANVVIVKALRTIRAQLQKLERAARAGDPAAAQEAAAAIQDAPEVAAAQRAARELERQGYELGALGR